MPAFLFDMDGTMVDSMPWHARSWAVFSRDVAGLLGSLAAAREP